RSLPPSSFAPPPGREPAANDGTLTLTLDDVRQPAYMVNHSLELTWFNDAARTELLGGFERLPAGHAERNVLPMIASLDDHAGGMRRDELLRAHVQLARTRLSRADLLAVLVGQSPELRQRVAELYDECPGAPEPLRDLPAAAAIPFERVRPDGTVARCQLVTSSFREGTLIICTDDDGLDETLLQFLARRDLMIRQLLRKRLPVFTPLAVLVADLQGSTRICSELPPEEYFELINDMRTAMDPIFRAHGATHGKHVGDGMLYFFFPQPDSHCVFNALRCAHEMREEMRRLSQRWALRKGWFNELLLNMAVHEGTEWLGTFQTATAVEFAVLGDTINQAARLGEFARHGTVWATKSLIGKLSADERARVQYGVSRRHPDGREVFVERTIAQIGTLATDSTNAKVGDVAQMAVAEVRMVQGSSGVPGGAGGLMP
ncbi:MAG: adenylate/guanylate cyclase domain-containing protein, partial [Burkholderiaceae bacterium]